jgi:transcriptional regulator with XRE-family HTH domain
MEHTAEALGQVIRELREARQPAMTQARLGELAGYGAGPGVSISRVETGVTRPGAQRFAGLALALGVTPEQLSDLAERRTEEHLRARAGGADEHGIRAKRRGTKNRLERVQQIMLARTDCVQELGLAFNVAHDRARDEFFLQFVEAASTIQGAAVPPELPPDVDDADAEESQGLADASSRVRNLSNGIGTQLAAGGVGGAAIGAAVGGAAAYATFASAAMFGTASTGAAIAGLSGAAATNATLALLGGGTLAAGGAGVAGGTLLLTGIVAAPIAALAAGGLFLIARRRSRQEDERLSLQLDQAEASLEATQSGFDALAEALPRATEVLEYIGVHSAHAVRKWQADLPKHPISWDQLSGAQQQCYLDFITIAACELAVDSMDAGKFMTLAAVPTAPSRVLLTSIFAGFSRMVCERCPTGPGGGPFVVGAVGDLVAQDPVCLVRVALGAGDGGEVEVRDLLGGGGEQGGLGGGRRCGCRRRAGRGW